MKSIILALLILSSAPAFADPARYAIVDQATGTVTNVVEIAPGDGSTVAAGTQQVQSESANIGDHWNGSTFTPPPH